MGQHHLPSVMSSCSTHMLLDKVRVMASFLYSASKLLEVVVIIIHNSCYLFESKALQLWRKCGVYASWLYQLPALCSLRHFQLLFCSRMDQHSRKMSLLLCETVRLRRKYREVSQLYIKLVSEVQYLMEGISVIVVYCKGLQLCDHGVFVCMCVC